jgi:tetratricopeptide (TPR) repeat protein
MPHSKPTTFLNQIASDDAGLSADEQVINQCISARDFSLSGNFEAARSAMNGLWQRVGQRPELDGLGRRACAEVLLRSGALCGWIGSSQQLDGAQETAKDLISESLSIFSELADDEKQAEAHVDLGICYWREGALSEASAMYQIALSLAGSGSVNRGRALMNLAVLEMWQSRHNEALQHLRQAAPIFEANSNQELKGRNHLQLALVYKKLYELEQREDYLDLALIEATEARYHFEQTGNKRDEAIVLNNLANLTKLTGRFDEAHVNLDRARHLFGVLGDRVNVARADDSRALLFLEQQDLGKAETYARLACAALDQGEEAAVLSEALTTYGKVLARQNNFSGARRVLERAVREASGVGHNEGAGSVCLTLIEELSEMLTLGELISTFKKGSLFFERNRERETLERLHGCAQIVINALPNPEATLPPALDKTLSLDEQVRHYEGLLIKQALDETQGSISRAAKILGTSHQGLSYKISEQHPELMTSRRPPRIRRRSIIKKVYKQKCK